MSTLITTLYTSISLWNQPSGSSAEEWLKTNGIDTQWSAEKNEIRPSDKSHHAGLERWLRG